MSISLQQFRENANKHGICAMAKDWDACETKKDLIDLCLSIRGIMFLAKAIAEGWGIDPDTICNEFPRFIDGGYVRAADGYTSSIYCTPNNNDTPHLAEIVTSTHAVLIINFIGRVILPNNYVGELHIVNSKCYILGGGKAVAYTYGDTEIYNQDSAPAIIKEG